MLVSFLVLSISIYLLEGGLSPLPRYWAGHHAKSWSEGSGICRAHGGYAVIRNVAEQNEANHMCRVRVGGNSACWIGATDQHNERHWHWQDNGALTYSNWGPNEPNNAGGNEDCAEIVTHWGGKWNDLPCHIQRHPLCKNEVTTRGYFRGPRRMHYLDAYAYCKSQNSILAAITDHRDNADAMRVAADVDVWIGLNDISAPNVWKYLDGTVSSYRNWVPGEPNNVGAGGEYCVHLWGKQHGSKYHGKWNDHDCLEFQAYPLCNPRPGTRSQPAAKKDQLNNNDLHENAKYFENNFDKIYKSSKNNQLNNELIKYEFFTNIISISLIISFILCIICVGYYYNCVKKTKTIPYQKVDNITSDSSAV